MVCTVGACAGAALAFDSLTHSQHAAVSAVPGVSAALFALACLIISKPVRYSIQPLKTDGGLRFAVGLLAIAASLFTQGGGWGIAGGICYAIMAPLVILLLGWLNRLSAEWT